jgi:hypothetical protein
MDSESLLKNVRKGLWICTIFTVSFGIGFGAIIGSLDNRFQKQYGIFNGVLMGMFILFRLSSWRSKIILIIKGSIIERVIYLFVFVLWLFVLLLFLVVLPSIFLSIKFGSEPEIQVIIISLICGGLIGTLIGIPVTLLTGLTNVLADEMSIEGSFIQKVRLGFFRINEMDIGDSTIKNIIWGFLLGGILGFIGGMTLITLEIIDDPLIICYTVITSSIVGLIISLLTLAIIGTIVGIFQYLAWTIEVILGGVTGTFLSVSFIVEGIITPFLSSIFFVAIPAGLILVSKYFYEDFPPLFKKGFNNAVVMIITSIFLTLYVIFCQSIGINPIFTQ